MICDICQVKPGAVWMVVRNLDESTHVGKAHACTGCFEEMQRQTTETPPGVKAVPTVIESVSQQEWNEIVENWPGKGGVA